MTTPAVAFLKKAGINFELLAYDHLEKGAGFAARATGFDPGLVIKTLVVDMGRRGFALALLPGNLRLSEKKLAKVMGVKRLAMARDKDAERVTGYLTGGISPFATRRKLPVTMEARLAEAPRVAINAGKRGLLVKMAPVDIIELLNCKLANIAILP